MKKLNLNCMVKVKLNDYGKHIFYHRNDDLNEHIRNRGGVPIQPRFPDVDSDGYSKFQLWDFMNIYGDYFRLGYDHTPLEGLNIYIEDRDLDEV